MRGACGYGRYNDDPDHVGCPRAKTDMTPCIARDGALALAGDFPHTETCVGCDMNPMYLLEELRKAGVTMMGAKPKVRRTAADMLKRAVRRITESEPSEPPFVEGGMRPFGREIS